MRRRAGCAATAVVVCVLAAWGATASAAPPTAAPVVRPVLRADAVGGVSLGPEFLEVYDGAREDATLTEVSLAYAAGRFTPVTGRVANFGFRRDPLWFRFALGTSADPLVVEIANPTLADVTVYRLVNDEVVGVTETGSRHPLSSRDLPGPAFVFTVPLVQATILVRVAGDGPVRVPIRVWTDQSYHAGQMPTAFANGAFYGGMALAVLFVLTLAGVARDRGHVALVIATTCACVALLNQDGYGPYYLWSPVATLGNGVTVVASLLAVLALFVFTNAFLLLDTRHPRLRHLLVAVAALCVVSAGLTAVVPVFQIGLVLGPATTFWCGIVSWRSGYGPARRFVAAWGVVLLGIGVGVAVESGIDVPLWLSADRCYKLVAAPALAIFCVGLVERLFTMRRDAERTEAALLRQESTLVEVAQGVIGSSGEEVFNDLVRHLSRALSADMVLVGELLPGKHAVRTVAAWRDGRLLENFEYALEHTPCAGVLSGGCCEFPEGVAAQFPRDRGLAEMGIEGYIGLALHDSARRPVGIVVCLYRRPIEDADAARRTVQIFAARAAAELERRRSERALRDQESVLRGILDNTPAVVYVKDPEGRYLLVNRAYEHGLRKTRDEILGRTDEDLYPPEAATSFRDGDLRAMASPEPMQFEERDGERVYLSTKAALRDAAGAVWAIVGVSTDISEFTRLQVQLRTAQRMEAFGQLAGGVAHDFNNLLTAILGYIELAASAAPTGSALADDLHEARVASLRASRITGQLLAFARRQRPTLQRAGLAAMLQDVERLLRQAAGAQVDLRFALANAPLAVHVDIGQFEQVVLNLVLNARDAMPDGGVATIATRAAEVGAAAVPAGSTASPGRYAVLEVSDTGVGIPPDALSRIFEPFFTTKDAGQGTGLGLAVCHGIVSQAGGFIAVRSVRGQGTTFAVHLPLLEGPAEAAAPEASLSAARGTETVLVVDDEPPVRALAARLLERHGYQVLQADDGPSAVATAESHRGPIDLLVSDVVMPGMNGPEVASEVRARRPEIAVMFMTGYAGPMLSALGEGGARCLAKPFTAAGLTAAVRQVLDARSAGRVSGAA